MDSSVRQVAHLMRRAGFSCGPDELKQRVERGLDATINDLIHYENTPDTLTDPISPTAKTDNLKLSDIQSFWLNRMIKSPRPLQEKMTLFWHGHFATAQFKVDNAGYMYRQNQLFRTYALADFRTMLQVVSRDPAMLVWLDNVANTKRAPNENYAREVMELFTMGRGNYSETDVKQAARAFSGWQIKDDRFWINIQDHDFTQKSVLGVTGRLNGDDIANILVRQPATARFMATKLLRFFATDTPDGAWVYRISQVFSQSGGDIRATVESIFRSDEFYSDSVMNGMYKSPTEFVVNAIRETGSNLSPRTASTQLRNMGQDLFNPPSVKGWDAGKSWINTATMLTRINFAATVAGSSSISIARLYQSLQDAGVQKAEDVVDHFQDRLGGVDFAAETRDSLVQVLNSSSTGLRGPFQLSQKSADVKVRNAIRLMLSSPEYQFN